MNLILYGFKRVGKTTYGKKLAEALKWPFADTDDLVVEAYTKKGHPKLEIHEIHQRLGEEEFRKLEYEVLSKLKLENFVLSVGGGTVLKPECQALLKKWGKLIYLLREKKQTKRSLSLGRVPTYLDADNFESSFEEMYAKRAPLYESLATHTLDVSHLTDKEILEALLEISKTS